MTPPRFRATQSHPILLQSEITVIKGLMPTAESLQCSHRTKAIMRLSCVGTIRPTQTTSLHGKAFQTRRLRAYIQTALHAACRPIGYCMRFNIAKDEPLLCFLFMSHNRTQYYRPKRTTPFIGPYQSLARRQARQSRLAVTD